MAAYLFDTDALSEVLKPRPLTSYLEWLREVPVEAQFTSAICIAELFEGAFSARERGRHLRNIINRVLPALVVLPFDVETARVFGELAATLRSAGRGVADPDLQIAATAIQHDLDLVTGNVKHFERVPGLRLELVLARSRPTTRR